MKIQLRNGVPELQSGKGQHVTKGLRKTIRLKIAQLPVHGDPILDDEDVPLEIRLIRKRVFDRLRGRKAGIRGRSAQKKIEKAFRRQLWRTDEGRKLEQECPDLPGHVRAVLPQIKAIARTDREYRLLIELSKSASTRNLIGSFIGSGDDVEDRVRSIESRTNDVTLKRQILQALRRLEREALLQQSTP